MNSLLKASLVLSLVAASIPAPTQQEVDIASLFSVQGIPGYPSAWTAVGADSSSDFTTAYADYFLCKISTTSGTISGDQVGLYNLKLGFCHKTTNALDHELDAATRDATLDETASGKTFQCQSGFFIDKIKVSFERSDRGMVGMRWMCRNPTTLAIDYTNSDGWYAVEFSNNAVTDQLHLMPEDEDYFICGVKARRHSAGDDPSNALGLIGLKLLRCKFCESSSDCLSGVTKKLKPNSAGTILPVIYESGVGEDVISCMDFSSEDGDLLIGGMASNGALRGDTDYVLPFLGMKTAAQSMAGNSWAWVRYTFAGYMFGFENCQFTPVVPFTGRRYIVSSQKAIDGDIKFFIVDPYVNGGPGLTKEFETNLLGRNVFQANEPCQDMRFVTTISTDGSKLITVFIRPDSTGTKIQISRMIFFTANGNAQMFHSQSVAASANTDWGSAIAFDPSTKSYYMGVTHMWDASTYGTTILRYLPQNYDEDLFQSETKSIEHDGVGLKMSVLNLAAPSKYFHVLGGIDYNERMVGMAYQKVLPGTVEADYQAAHTGNFMFVGECSKDDFYTLEVVSGRTGSFNAKGVFAVSSTVTYAILNDFNQYLTYQSTFLVVKIEFNPDPANCATKGYLSDPKIGIFNFNEGFIVDRFDGMQSRGTYYDPFRKAFFFLGTSNHFKGEAQLSSKAGYFLPKTLTEVDAGMDYNYTFTTTKQFNPVSQTSFSNKFSGTMGMEDGTLTIASGLHTAAAFIWTARSATPTSCANAITANPSTAFITGFQKELIVNSDPAAFDEVPFTEFFSNSDPSGCPATYDIRMAHDSHPYRTDLHAHQLRKDACKYKQASSSYWELTATSIKFKPQAKVNLPLMCLVVTTAVDVQVSNIFHFIVDDFFCRSAPITHASSPVAKTLSHYVYYSLDKVRTPTQASNVTSYTLDLVAEGTVAFANNAQCPLTYAITEVLKNDSSTMIPVAQWSSIISIHADTAVITVNNYGAIAKEFFFGAIVKVKASNRDQDVTFSALALTIEEEVGLEVNEPPYFTQELKKVILQAVVGGPDPTTKVIEVELPPISDKNGDRIQPVVPTISPLMTHFVEFSQKYNKFLFRLGEMTLKDAAIPRFSVPIKIEDHRGLSREYEIKIEMKITVHEDAQLEEGGETKEEGQDATGAERAQNSTNSTNSTLGGNQTANATTDEEFNSTEPGTNGSGSESNSSVVLPPTLPSGSGNSDIGIFVPDLTKYSPREDEIPKNPNEIIIIEPLKAVIDQISTLGKVTIVFNQAIQPLDLAAIDDSVLFIQVEPGPYELPPDFDFSLYSFEWEPLDMDYTFNKLTLQINFANAIAISPEPGFQDRLRITIMNRDLFRSKEFDLPLDPRKRTFRSNIQKQMPNTDASHQLDQTTEQTREALSASTVISLLLSLVFQGAMKQVLDTILSLQVLIHMFLFTIQFPANISTFVQKLKPVASFNIVRSVTQFTIQYVGLDIERQSEVRDEIILPAQDLGITQHNSVKNLGNVFHMELAYFALLLLFVPVALVSLFSDRFIKRAAALKKKIIFGDLIQILTSGFIAISVAVYLQLRQPMDTTFGERLGVHMAQLSAALLFGFLPLAILHVIFASQEQLEDPHFQRKWGALYANMRFETRLQRAFKMVFLLRRFLVLAVGFILNASPPLQLLIINIMNLAVAIYQGLASPFRTFHEARMDLFNEFLSVVVTYHLFMFTDLVPNKALQYAGGWSAVGVLGLMVGANAYFVLKGMLRNFYLLLKRTIIRLKQRGAEKRFVADFYSQSKAQRGDLLKQMSRIQMQKLFLEQSLATHEDNYLKVEKPSRKLPARKTSKLSNLSVIKEEESVEDDRIQGTLELYSAIYALQTPAERIQSKQKKIQSSRMITISVEPELEPNIFHPSVDVSGEIGSSMIHTDAGDLTHLSQKAFQE